MLGAANRSVALSHSRRGFMLSGARETEAAEVVSGGTSSPCCCWCRCLCWRSPVQEGGKGRDEKVTFPVARENKLSVV